MALKKIINCFLCQRLFKDHEKTWSIFDENSLKSTKKNCSLSKILSSALGFKVKKSKVQSICICDDCKILTLEYENLEKCLHEVQQQILLTYNCATLLLNNIVIDTNKSDIEKDNKEMHLLEIKRETVYKQIMEMIKTKKQIGEEREYIDPLQEIMKFDGNVENTTEAVNIKKAETTSTEFGNHTEFDAEINSENESLVATETSTEFNSFDMDKSKNSIENELINELLIKPKENKNKKKNFFPCDICDKIFSYKRSLTRHKNVVHSIIEVKFSKDRKNVVVDDDFSTQVENVYKCTFCQKMFSSRGSLRYHMEVHNDNISYHCNICFKIFQHKRNLNEHKLIHIKINQRKLFYRCHICNEGFSSHSSLRQHRYVHNSLRGSYQCDICQKKFKQLRYLRTHKIVHRKSKFRCNKCDKNFSTVQILNYHIALHNKDEFQFSCNICQKKFVNENRLSLHQAFHNKNKDFLCEMCGKSFLTKQRLIGHYVVHVSVRQFKCEFCEKDFTTKCRLLSHMRRVKHSKQNKPT